MISDAEVPEVLHPPDMEVQNTRPQIFCTEMLQFSHTCVEKV